MADFIFLVQIIALLKSDVNIPIFDLGSDFTKNVLHVWNCDRFIFNVFKSTGKKNKDLVHDVSEIVAIKVEESWCNAIIYIVEYYTILEKIKDHRDN